MSPARTATADPVVTVARRLRRAERVAAEVDAMLDEIDARISARIRAKHPRVGRLRFNALAFRARKAAPGRATLAALAERHRDHVDAIRTELFTLTPTTAKGAATTLRSIVAVLDPGMDAPWIITALESVAGGLDVIFGKGAPS